MRLLIAEKLGSGMIVKEGYRTVHARTKYKFKKTHLKKYFPFSNPKNGTVKVIIQMLAPPQS